MNNKEEVPSWFQYVVEKLNSKYAEFTAKIDELLNRIKTLENRFNSLTDLSWIGDALFEIRKECKKNASDNATLKEQVKITEKKIADYRAKLDYDHKRVKAIDEHSILCDVLEVKFSGVPVGLDNREAVQKILEAIGREDLSVYMHGIREWLPKATLQSENSNKTQANETKIISVHFNVARQRDSVVGRSYKLKYKTCQKIFGCGGEGKVSINAVWPKQVYELYRLAVAFSKELNYAKPVIRNLIVCMRETRKSEVIPIRLPEQFQELAPRLS